MLDFEERARALAAACVADDRPAAEQLAFDLEFNVGRLGHMPPDVFDVVAQLLRDLEPRRSSTYVLLVNLMQQQWSKMTSYQRQQILEILEPHSLALEHFEALQAIIEVCHGQYLR